MKRTDKYTGLAAIYDRLMNHVNYKAWAKYISEITLPVLPRHSKVLELAAGTGKFSTYFSENYPNMVLSDLSASMLQIAEKRCIFPLVAADFRHLPFREGAFDCVLCLYDSINYLLQQKEVAAMMLSVRSVLQPGGYFIFDCCLINGSIIHSESMYRSEHYKGVEVTQHSQRVEKTNTHINTFYMKFPSGEIILETHKQKIYPLSFFIKTLLINGFEVLHCFSDASFDNATEDSHRAHIVARKR